MDLHLLHAYIEGIGSYFLNDDVHQHSYILLVSVPTVSELDIYLYYSSLAEEYCLPRGVIRFMDTS